MLPASVTIKSSSLCWWGWVGGAGLRGCGASVVVVEEVVDGLGRGAIFCFAVRCGGRRTGN